MTQQGVQVDKSRSNFLLFAILSSKDPAWDPVALGDYASRNVLPNCSVCPVWARPSCSAPSVPCVWIDPPNCKATASPAPT